MAWSGPPASLAQPGLRWRWRTWSLAALGLAVAVGLVAVPLVRSRRPKPIESALVVQPQPFTVTISVVGAVTPASSIDVVAPFDGAVRSLGFTYGEPVIQGQALAVLDTFDAVQHRNDAETAYLKALQTQDDLAHWEQGPETARARRAVTAAELQLRSTRQKMEETSDLLARGLVARTEYEALQEQARTQEAALAAAREELAVTLRRGQGPSRREAVLDLANARARLDDARRQIDGATVRAPVSGVAILPASDTGSGEAKGIHQGQRLGRGQLIASIAEADVLAVAIKLEEGDARRVRVGQSATVTGPGFGERVLSGRVVSVAGQGTPGLGGAGATFAARVALDRGDNLRDAGVHIGMTADVSIVTYSQDRALVVPVQAVLGGGPTAFVQVRNSKARLTETRRVRLGQVSPRGVEVLDGLNAGDQIVWSPSAPGSVSP